MDNRREQEHLFDKMLGQVESVFVAAGERTAEALDMAIDTALGTIAGVGEFTAENAERFRHYLKRDLLHREHPGMTFRSGEITSAGTLSCTRCGWTITNTRTSVLPPCPQCGETTFRKTA
jgi:rubrerythrin